MSEDSWIAKVASDAWLARGVETVALDCRQQILLSPPNLVCHCERKSLMGLTFKFHWPGSMSTNQRG